MSTALNDIVRVRDAPRYLPTPAEIASLCAEIRRAWSPAETDRRWALSRPVLWFPPRSSFALRHHGD
jgi:hypothetical protein